MLYLLKNWAVHSSTQILILRRLDNYHQNSGGGTSEALRWYLRVDDPVFIEGRDILFLYKYDGWVANSASFEDLRRKFKALLKNIFRIEIDGGYLEIEIVFLMIWETQLLFFWFPWLFVVMIFGPLRIDHRNC